MKEIKEQLSMEIKDAFLNLKEVAIDSDGYEYGANGVAKLIDKLIDLEKFEIENSDKEKIRDEEKKDRLIKNGIAVAGIVVPVCVTIWGTLKTLQFEKEGTVTSLIGRGFISNLLRK